MDNCSMPSSQCTVFYFFFFVHNYLFICFAIIKIIEQSCLFLLMTVWSVTCSFWTYCKCLPQICHRNHWTSCGKQECFLWELNIKCITLKFASKMNVMRKVSNKLRKQVRKKQKQKNNGLTLLTWSDSKYSLRASITAFLSSICLCSFLDERKYTWMIFCCSSWHFCWKWKGKQSLLTKTSNPVTSPHNMLHHHATPHQIC